MAKETQNAVVFNEGNVLATLEGPMLIIRVDTSKRLRESRPTIDKKTGAVIPPKSLIIGTTGGNKPITLPDGSTFKLSLTAYQPKQAEVVSA